MPQTRVATPLQRTQLHHLIRIAAGWLLTALAMITWPTCWLLSGLLHADRLGVGFAAFTFDEPIGDFALHHVLVFVGPWGSLIFAAVGFELRRSR